MGYTHTSIEYELPAPAFGEGTLTPTLVDPPGSEMALDGSFKSGPGAPKSTEPTYVPSFPLEELSRAVGPEVSFSSKYCVGLSPKTADAYPAVDADAANRRIVGADATERNG
jgi:hypothetical protein